MLRNNRHYPRGGQRAIDGVEGVGGGDLSKRMTQSDAHLKKLLLYPETVHEASVFQ